MPSINTTIVINIMFLILDYASSKLLWLDIYAIGRF